MTLSMRRLVHNAGLAILSIVVVLALTEVFLRVVLPLRVSMEVRYEPDGHLGFRLEPNRVYRLAGGGVCTIDSLGFRRNHPIEVPKPAGVFRMVALGGSSTFSYDVSDDETWVQRLEDELNRRLGAPIEVINAGVPGYSSFDSKINYVYRIRPLDPDAVLVYHTWNDLKRFRVLEQFGYFLRGVREPSRIESLLRHFQIAWRARNLYRHRIQRAQREDSYPTLTGLSEPIPRHGVAHRWERRNFEDLARWLRGDGVLPILVTQAGLLSPSGLDDGSIRRLVAIDYVGMTHAILLEQWEAVSDTIREVAREQDGILVDARRLVPADTEHFLDAVHLTAKGNAVLATAIADQLVRDPRLLTRLPPTRDRGLR